jgi:hypothetical protein
MPVDKKISGCDLFIPPPIPPGKFAPSTVRSYGAFSLVPTVHRWERILYLPSVQRAECPPASWSSLQQLTGLLQQLTGCIFPHPVYHRLYGQVFLAGKNDRLVAQSQGKESWPI